MFTLWKKLCLVMLGILFMSSLCFAVYVPTKDNGDGQLRVRIGQSGGPSTEARQVKFMGEIAGTGGGYLTLNESAYFVVAKNAGSVPFIVVAGDMDYNRSESNGVVTYTSYLAQSPNMRYNVRFNLDDEELWGRDITMFFGPDYGSTGTYINISDLLLGTHHLHATVKDQCTLPSGASGSITDSSVGLPDGVTEEALMVVIDMGEETRTINGTSDGDAYSLDLSVTAFDGKGKCYMGVEWFSMQGTSTPSNLYLDSACTQPVTGDTQMSYMQRERLWGVNENERPVTLFYKRPVGNTASVTYKVKLVYKDSTNTSNMIVRNVTFNQ